jgi:hypothetical protein
LVFSFFVSKTGPLRFLDSITPGHYLFPLPILYILFVIALLFTPRGFAFPFTIGIALCLFLLALTAGLLGLRAYLQDRNQPSASSPAAS